MGECHQAEVAALGMVGTSVDVRTLATFDHRHHGFDLSALMIGVRVEADLHQSSIVSGRGLRRGTAVFGRNDRADIPLLAGHAVVGFGVVPGVGHHPRQAYLLQSLGDQGPELVHIGSGQAKGDITDYVIGQYQ